MWRSAPSSRISDERTQWNEARLREAEQELESVSSKKQRAQIANTVAQRQNALQKARSDGVNRALEEAEAARILAEEAKMQMQLALDAADTAQVTADEHGRQLYPREKRLR